MIGQRVGAYRVISQIGEGGMGTVFEARHEQIERRAAIKILRREVATDPTMASRFFNEARAVNLIDHPGLVQIHEFGQLSDGTLYLVMEHLKGETLAARMEARRLGLSALPSFQELAATVAAAHARGIIHRDLKPQNVMLVEDPAMPGGERIKVLDFGIAKFLAGRDEGGGSARTRTGQLLGTPRYMAPEQCHGASLVDAQADVYSLGVMLYEALCGAPPFVSDGAGALMAMHIYERPPPLRRRQPDLPDALTRLVHSMLAKDPRRRPAMATVAEALAELAAPAARPPASPSTLSPAQLVPKRRRAGNLALVVALGGALVAAILAAGAAYRALRPRAGAGAAAPRLAPPPPRTAAEDHRAACERGHAGACFELARLYDDGKEVARDPARAAKLFERACTAGSALGCFNLAVDYQDGEGVRKDPARAAASFRRACDTGDAEGCYWLAVRHETGDGVTADRWQAVALYERACHGDLAHACTRAGLRLVSGRRGRRDLLRASQLYERACALLDPEACNHLGYLFDEGIGVRRNPERAAALYDRGCDQGRAQSCDNLGWMLYTGRGVRAERGRALTLLRQACAAGYEPSCEKIRKVEGAGPGQDHG